MAEGDIYKFTWADRNQEYLLRLFKKTEQKHGFTNWTAWNYNVRVDSANLTKAKGRNKLQILPRI